MEARLFLRFFLVTVLLAVLYFAFGYLSAFISRLKEKKELGKYYDMFVSCHVRVYTNLLDGDKFSGGACRSLSHILSSRTGGAIMSISISFFSNFFNAHQLPVAKELNANPCVDFAFIAMQRIEGLEGRVCLNDRYPLCRQAIPWELRSGTSYGPRHWRRHCGVRRYGW